MIALSVSSSSSWPDATPVSARILARVVARSPRSSCTGETLTDITIPSRPAWCQARKVVQASLNTHSPISRIRPVSSASGMNWSGGIAPNSGLRQRSSASAPTTRSWCSE